MDDTDQLRNRATRLFALAQKAREKGHPDYAKELTWLQRNGRPSSHYGKAASSAQRAGSLGIPLKLPAYDPFAITVVGFVVLLVAILAFAY